MTVLSSRLVSSLFWSLFSPSSCSLLKTFGSCFCFITTEIFLFLLPTLLPYTHTCAHTSYLSGFYIVEYEILHCMCVTSFACFLKYLIKQINKKKVTKAVVYLSLFNCLCNCRMILAYACVYISLFISYALSVSV